MNKNCKIPRNKPNGNVEDPYEDGYKIWPQDRMELMTQGTVGCPGTGIADRQRSAHP